MAKIKKLTFQQACKKTGNHPVNSLPYPKKPTKDQEAWNALKRLEIFITAYNMVCGKKWVADYSNTSQAKWRIWFVWDSAARAFRFVYTSHGCTNADSATGSRHACRTEEIADHVGTAHLDEWNKWLVKEA